MSPAKKKQKTKLSQFDQLKEFTIVVADTGDIDAINKFKPQDATTNPSLIYKAAAMTEYAHLVDDAVKYAKGDLSLAMVSMIDYMDWLMIWIDAMIVGAVGRAYTRLCFPASRFFNFILLSEAASKWKLTLLRPLPLNELN